MNIANKYANRANALIKKAEDRVKAVQKQIDKLWSSWDKGNDKHIGIKKDSDVQSLGVEEEFYRQYFVARLDSDAGTRFLIFDESGKEEKLLEEMIHASMEYRDDLDSELRGTY
jgi:hypothetical protein